MSLCGVCGAQLPESGQFCPQCGAMVGMPAPPPETKSLASAPGHLMEKNVTSPPLINPENLGHSVVPPTPVQSKLYKPPLTAGLRVRVRPPVTPRDKTAVPPPSSSEVPVDLQGKKWHYQKKGQGQPAGPVDEQQIRQWLAAGLLQADDLVWTQELPNWITSQEAGLVPVGGKTPPVPPQIETPAQVSLEPPPPPPPPTAILDENWPCPSCGQTMPASARFCRHCGAEKMVSPEIQPTPESAPLPSVPSLELVCPHCNRPEPAHANFCRHCGGALNVSPQTAGTGVCPQCQQPFVPGANFCRACGFKVGEPLTGAKTPVLPPPLPGIAPVSQMSPTTGAAVYAGFWWRTLALILDSVPLGLVIGAFSLSLFGAFPADPYQMARAPGRTAFFYIFTVLVVWLYFALLESSPWQATPGKRALGVYVTDLQGRRLTLGRATARNFGKYISGLILGIGYLMAGFTKQKQALHDLMAQCLVWKKGQ